MSQILSPGQLLSPEQIADLRLAVSKMHGADRRAFQAEMALKYCRGSARLSETVFGWTRQTVALGLEEKRTGIICVGAQSGLSTSSPSQSQVGGPDFQQINVLRIAVRMCEDWVPGPFSGVDRASGPLIGFHQLPSVHSHIAPSIV